MIAEGRFLFVVCSALDPYRRQHRHRPIPDSHQQRVFPPPVCSQLWGIPPHFYSSSQSDQKNNLWKRWWWSSGVSSLCSKLHLWERSIFFLILATSCEIIGDSGLADRERCIFFMHLFPPMTSFVLIFRFSQVGRGMLEALFTPQVILFSFSSAYFCSPSEDIFFCHFC